MKKLTTFINGLLENGNAQLIETTDNPNIYCETFWYYDGIGKLDSATFIEEYNQPLIINGEVNPSAKSVSVNIDESRTEEDFSQLLCRLVKNNLSSDKSVVLSDSRPSVKTEVVFEERQFILNIAEHILGMSNHVIVSCVSTSLNYLENYLIEEVMKNVKISQHKDIDSIAKAEDDLMSRIEHICDLASKLKSKDLTREEYNSIYPEWIKLYEDREFHRWSSNGKSEEKQRNLLTSND